jgi:tol-pal system protein YbgF
MAFTYKHQHSHKYLIILIVLLLSGCSSNPTKEDEAKDSYDNLYRGSSENKTANDAAIAADTPEEAIARGDEAYRKGQYDIALYEYVDALKLNGGDTETLNKVGDIHYTLEDFDSAAGAYNASIQLEDKNQHALLGLGLIQLRTRKYEQAKIYLSDALKGKPNLELWLAHNGLGTIADIEGNYTAAIEHYRSALRLNPHSAQVLNNLGYSEYLSGNWDKAMMHFVQAVNSDRNFDRAWYNIGLIYTRQGKYEDAFDALRNVLDTPQAYNDIGYLSMMDGYYDIAEHYYQKAIKTSPSYYLKAHENIDRLERQRKRGATPQQVRAPSRSAPRKPIEDQTDSSQDIIIAVNEIGEPVVTVAPVPGNAAVDIVEIVSGSNTTVVIDEQKTGEPPEPVEIFSQPKKTDNTVLSTTDNPDINDTDTTPATASSVKDSESGNTIASSSSNEDSISDISGSNKVTTEKAGSYDTQGEQTEYRKALAMVRDGQFEDAASSFNTFLDTYPESRYADNANYWIGETYYVTRDFEPALETFTDLIEEFPDSPKVPDTRLKIGYIHYEQHDWSAAREELSSIVSAYPDSEVAQLANARIKRMKDEGNF